MKIKLTNFIPWLLINLVILSLYYSLIAYLFSDFPKEEPSFPQQGLWYFWSILSHNITNYLQTVITFFLFPLNYLFVWGHSFLIISQEIKYFGISYAFDKLLPHGLIEFPLILFYQYLSYRLLYLYIKRKSLKVLLNFILENKYYFLSTVPIMALSAGLEAFIT
ncbi:stage II sporulation protein M [Lactococcus termiticola]|uniref:Stage II sporulation protein M n=1 Tax=Lactococcus termiticola TaxID=2169526 RepID=A0A2R5HFA9_9LACT|nr:stage II sporulation protein M [Lactococcus termiticola]GBG95975.1 hypothetical protein NtB2_00077 [Lactococcus termiticola]